MQYRTRVRSRSVGPVVAAATAMAILATGAMAGGDVSVGTPAQPPLAADVVTTQPVTDAKLRQFAVAAAEIETIREELMAEMQDLQQVAEARMVSSVEDSGMTVDEFKTLFQDVQADPDLARRLESLDPAGAADSLNPTP